MAQIQNHTEEIGQILVKVHEDLKQFKEQVNLYKISGKEFDVKAIDEALKKTEAGLKKKTDVVFNLVSNKVQTLPSLSQSRPLIHYNDHESVQYTSISQQHPTRAAYRQKFPEELTLKALLNPENCKTREVLNRNYGLVLPKIKRVKSSSKVVGQLHTNQTIEPLTVLPPANRKDPSLPPPPIEEKDAKKGILSLIERGLIPATAELLLDPSPVSLKKATLYDGNFVKKGNCSETATLADENHYMSLAKIDLSNSSIYNPVTRIENSEQDSSQMSFATNRTISKSNYINNIDYSLPQKKVLNVQLYKMPLKSPPNTAVVDQQLAIPSEHHINDEGVFYIINGVMPTEQDSKFSSFQQFYCLQWGPILTLLQQLVIQLNKFSVPYAIVNRKRLASLASHYELEYKPGIEELISVLENSEETMKLIQMPGRRFISNPDAAATVIQASWRRFSTRKFYKLYRKQRWASGMILLGWFNYRKRLKIKERLAESRKRHLENYKIRLQKLAANWTVLKEKRHVVVHVPSLGFDVKERKIIPGFTDIQNLQAGRIFELIDQNVDIIYISPVKMDDDIISYFDKLLALKKAVQTGQPENIESMKSRLTILTPDAASRIRKRSMNLAATLYYSYKTLKRIKTLIAGRPAYYVPGYVCRDDLAVADVLDLPVLTSEPQITHLYSSKSGSKRIFAAASIEIPPGDFDIYTEQQLNETLAWKIVQHPNITKWLLKIDTSFCGRGIAFIDVEKYLPCYEYMKKQVKKFGDKWRYRWAKEDAFIKVLDQLPDTLSQHAETAKENVYKTWPDFLQDYLSKGGIIEAYPPSSVTCLTVDLLIEPNGTTKIKSCGDHLYADNVLDCFGTSVPQTSIDPDVLVSKCEKIGSACRSRGVIGYFSVDFVTFIDGLTMKQQIWGIDLKLYYSDQMSMTNVMLYLSGGSLDPYKSTFIVPPRMLEEKRFEKRKKVEEKQKVEENRKRFAVMSNKLFHSNFAVIHKNVFIQMCRAHNIGFDIREIKGTIFLLVNRDRLSRMGMMFVF